MQEQETVSAAEIVETVAETTPESPAVEATAPIENAPDLSAHFAEIKRKDRELHAERQRLKDERAAMDAERAGFKAQAEKEFLASVYGPEDEPSEADLTRKEIEELKAWRKEQDDARANQANEQKLSEAREQVFTSLDASKHELVLASSQGKELLWNSIVTYCEANGVAPNVMEMADLVETQLLEEGKRLFSTSKFKPSEPEVVTPKVAAPAVPETDKSQQSGFKTISNSMTAKSAPKMKLVDAGKSQAAGLHTPLSSYMDEKRSKLYAKINQV